MKALADGESNIILRLDIMEKEDRQREKSFADVGSEGTAIALRLSQPYFGSASVIHADFVFSSARTCLELRKNGLHVVGCIKKASREFSERYLASFEDHRWGGESSGYKVPLENVLISVCYTQMSTKGEEIKRKEFRK